MGIDIANPAAGQAVHVDKPAHLCIRSGRRRRKVLKIIQYCGAIGELPQRQLTNDEGVAENILLSQQAHQLLITGAQMVHPHRRVDEDHFPLPV